MMVIGARQRAVCTRILGFHLVPLCEGRKGVRTCIVRWVNGTDWVRRQKMLKEIAA